MTTQRHSLFLRYFVSRGLHISQFFNAHSGPVGTKSVVHHRVFQIFPSQMDNCHEQQIVKDSNRRQTAHLECCRRCSCGSASVADKTTELLSVVSNVGWRRHADPAQHILQGRSPGSFWHAKLLPSCTNTRKDAKE